MSMSGYQIELVLNDFRKRYGYKRVPTHKVDALEISEEAQYEASRIQPYISRRSSSAEWISPEKILDLVADQTEYDPIVEYEQQRRAGLFVNPLYFPQNPPPSIRKVYDYLGAKKARDGQVSQQAEAGGRSIESGPQTQTTPDRVASHPTEGRPDESEPTTSTTKVEGHPKEGAGIIIEEEEMDDLAFTEEEERSDEDSNVVYGMGRITRDATIQFIHQHSDSAIKFIAKRDLDGKPLPVSVQEVHEEWSQRGLSRKRIRDYILEIMEWEKMPDQTLMEIWSVVRDRIYDVL